MRAARWLLGAALVMAAARPTSSGSKYLFVWAGDGARKASDFLAVIDADPASRSYGKIVGSAAVGAVGTGPHHTEYEFPPNGMLVANGFGGDRTFVFDLRTPTAPKVAASFGDVGRYAFPHSFARLPNGHVLATFQGRGAAYAPPGGLVELDDRGAFVRGVSGKLPGLADTLAWPYSLAIDAAHDRVVTTNTAMLPPTWATPTPGSWTRKRADAVHTSQIAIWRLSDLAPLHVVTLPKPPNAAVTGGYTVDEFAAEPRMLADGSAYVNTFTCGLYHVTGVASTAPKAALVHTFPTTRDMFCGVPAIVGHYWIQTVPAITGLIALDIRDPAHPVEVSRVTLAKGSMPHWLASDASASRVVVTGDDMGYVLIVNVDPRTGKLAIDSTFRDERTRAPGVNLDGRTWPHGAVARAFVHGTLFGPR